MVDRLSADDESVRRLIARFERPEEVWACYEAGPTGYELARVLGSARMHCEVIAPSLISADLVTGSKPTVVTLVAWPCRSGLGS